MKITCKIIVGALTLGLAGVVLAAGDLPPQQTFGGVSYITGGIGLDESTAIKAAEKDFTLSLVFAQTKRGEYLSDIKLSVKDGCKTVLEAVSDGNMLLARLPVGVYKVSGLRWDNTGETVRSSQGVTRAAFVWQPTSKATME